MIQWFRFKEKLQGAFVSLFPDGEWAWSRLCTLIASRHESLCCWSFC